MTSDDVKPDKSDEKDGGRELSPEQAAAAAMVAEARKRGLELPGHRAEIAEVYRREHPDRVAVLDDLLACLG